MSAGSRWITLSLDGIEATRDSAERVVAFCRAGASLPG